MDALRFDPAKEIKKGKVLVFPTDTVYGLLCDLTNKKAVDKLYKIKKRQKNKPLPVFIKDIEAARKLAKINSNQKKYLKKNWPGKITVVLERNKSRVKIYGIDKKTIALRIPKHRLVLKLLKKTKKPLAGTSANIAGKSAPIKIKTVIRQFKNKKHQPDFIINRGDLPKNKPSKIIDLTVWPPKTLRF